MARSEPGGRAQRRAGAARPPGPRPELADGVKALLPDELIDELLASARTEQGIAGAGGLPSQLTKRLVEHAMEVELTDHLSYEPPPPPHEPPGGVGNTIPSWFVAIDVGLSSRLWLIKAAVGGPPRTGARQGSRRRARAQSGLSHDDAPFMSSDFTRFELTLCRGLACGEPERQPAPDFVLQRQLSYRRTAGTGSRFRAARRMGRKSVLDDPLALNGQIRGCPVTTVIAFDVNETLLNLRNLDPQFEVLFGSATLRAQWLAQMLQLSFVGGLTGQYIDFTAAQRAALHMLGSAKGPRSTTRPSPETVDLMRTLPPLPEVAETLQTLAGTSLRVVALTNSTAEVADAQLTHLRDLSEGCALGRQRESTEACGGGRPARGRANAESHSLRSGS